MKSLLLTGLAALAICGSTPSLAQSRSNDWPRGESTQRGGWDRDAFWRGASRDPIQRIAFVQDRIQRGIADRSLDRREARSLQLELNGISRDARRMGRLDQRETLMLQDRLDRLAQKVRWQRSDDDYARGPDRDARFATSYDAARDYRDGARYQERRLTEKDEVYRGSDGRYYCKRSDGTTGLIVGAVGGAALGNVIDGGHERAAGTLIGGVLGALIGKSIDQNSDIRCK
jgi:hypothetical protein